MTNTLLAKVSFGAILLLVDFLTRPSFSLFGVLLAFIAVDFVTGIIKSKFLKNEITSDGLRRTVIKLMQYLIPVLILWGASMLIKDYKIKLEQASGWVMMFIIYIELTSIIENLYEIDSKSMVGRYLYKYALIILKFGLENNAVKKAADEVSNENKKGK